MPPPHHRTVLTVACPHVQAAWCHCVHIHCRICVHFFLGAFRVQEGGCRKPMWRRKGGRTSLIERVRFCLCSCSCSSLPYRLTPPSAQPQWRLVWDGVFFRCWRARRPPSPRAAMLSQRLRQRCAPFGTPSRRSSPTADQAWNARKFRRNVPERVGGFDLHPHCFFSGPCGFCLNHMLADPEVATT